METRGALGYTDCAILLSAKCRTSTVTQRVSFFCQKSLRDHAALHKKKREKYIHLFHILRFLLPYHHDQSQYLFFHKVTTTTTPSKPSIDLDENTYTKSGVIC